MTASDSHTATAVFHVSTSGLAAHDLYVATASAIAGSGVAPVAALDSHLAASGTTCCCFSGMQVNISTVASSPGANTNVYVATVAPN